MSIDHSISRSWDEGSVCIPWGPSITDGSGTTRHYDLCYALIPGQRPLFCDVTVPKHSPGERVPVIVWVHGGAWMRGSHKRHPVELDRFNPTGRMVEAGYAVASIDYRKGREANVFDMCRDLRAAVRWLRHYADDFDLDVDRFAYWGESAGAHLCLLTTFCTALDSMPPVGDFPDEPDSVQAIIDWYGPADCLDFPEHFAQVEAGEIDPKDDPLANLLQGTSATLEEISPALIVQQDMDVPPVLIVHGDVDELVPVRQSRRLRDALDRCGHLCEYRELPGADHVFMGYKDVPGVIEAGIDFLNRTLGRR